MAVIYSYPIKSTPDNDDLILISDGTDNLTKQVRVSTLPGGSSAGVSSFNTLTGAVTITGGTNVTLNPVGNNIEINATGGNSGISVQGAGGTPVTGITTLNFRHNFAVGAVGTTATMDVLPYGNNTEIQFKNGTAFGASSNLTFSTDTLTVKDNVIIRGDGTTNAGKLRLECYDNVNTHYIDLIGPDHGGGAASYSVKFPATGPANAQMILQSDASGVLSWINTPSSGGGGAVDSVSTTDGTFIDLTPNSATTGAVTVTADLSAVDGTSDTSTKFLSKDNTWDVPSYTTNTDTTYSAGTGLTLAGTTFSLAANAALTNLGGGSGSTFLQKDGTWATPTSTNTNIGGNNLTLTNNRTLDFYSDTSDKSLTFISTISGTKTLFKFDTVTNKPRLTIGDTASTYEGTLDIKGNGSNRTGKINLYNAAGTYSINIQAPTTFGANLDIPYVLPNTQGAASTFLQNNGSGTLTWAVPTNTTDITLTTTGSSGAATWNGTTLNIPQYSGGSGSGASLGFAPLEIYSANGATQASYIYYMVAVCDVDLTVNKCKVAVTSGTGAVYVAVYSMNYGSLQTSTLTKLGDLSIAGAVAGVNELSLVDSAFSLTAGQTICIGVSTANLLSAGTGINNTDLGVMATSGGGSALPTTPDFEGLGSANKRPAIHFYAS